MKKYKKIIVLICIAFFVMCISTMATVFCGFKSMSGRIKNEERISDNYEIFYDSCCRYYCFGNGYVVLA